ncbi:hypothetical protein [Mycolicibacterium wolinskyi]|uniref:hypothetical protein n=1 Tax=Mycolicibacterium wolinskyi TaxID=59750 RepID=UPI0039176F61
MTSSKPKVVICDDDPQRAETWQRNIASASKRPEFEYQVVSGEHLVDEIDILNRRRDAARKTADPTDQVSVFDSAALAILDFDLTPDIGTRHDFANDHAFAQLQQDLRGRTGELLAYLARCYSSVGYTVVVNQGYQDQSFDLTLQRFSASKADLNVTHPALTSAALWTGVDVPENLNSWAWPRLDYADQLWRSRLDNAKLDAPVFDTLGINPAVDRLAPRQIDLLTDSPEVKETAPEDITFDDVVSSSLGLFPKDQQRDPDLRLRIAVSVVGRWLDHWVIPGQNVLVDEPHIAALFPAAYPDIDLSERDWKRGSGVHVDTADGLDYPLKSTPPAAQMYCQRPVWRVSEVREVARSHRLPDRPVQMVFCEDVSAFADVSACVEVETDVPGPFVRRYIKRLASVRYYPLPRLYSA